MVEEGKRLETLLRSQWRTQAEAAKALGVAQSSIPRWVIEIPASFREKYGPRLAQFGLNVEYVFDETQPMRIDETALDMIGAEIESLQKRVEDVAARIESYKPNRYE